MSFRIEEKLKVAESKIFQLRDWITKNMGVTLYPTRTINSIYFDNQDYTMYNQSIEGVLPRKKIRLRVYGKEFSPNKSINKEIKVSSVEGKYKITELPVVWYERVIGKSNFKIIEWVLPYIKWIFYAINTIINYY